MLTAADFRQVAKESAAQFNPEVRIEAHHANIKDQTFNLAWYKSFDIVFNALDNVDARRHVNKMCLVANVPLIESGTQGFEGQVQVIKKVCRQRDEVNPRAIQLICPRVAQNATIATRSKHPSHTLSAQSEALPVNPFIV